MGQCFSKCSPWTSRIIMKWMLVRYANPQGPAQTYWNKNSGCETQQSTHTVCIFANMTLFARFSVLTMLLPSWCMLEFDPYFKEWIQKLSPALSHSWLCLFIIFFECNFHFMCASSKHLKYPNLCYCYFCAYLFYPISLKLLKEQKLWISL